MPPRPWRCSRRPSGPWATRVALVEASGSVRQLVDRLEAARPELILNTAEGGVGRGREAYYPALFSRLGVPFTGSDLYVCTVTLDKHLTKLMLAALVEEW
jgi:D-alanine-D-alanine ligase